MRITHARAGRPQAYLAAAFALLALCLSHAGAARAQQPWSTPDPGANNNISNTNTGNVGVGTSSPGYKLEVNGVTRSGAGAVFGTELGGFVASGFHRVQIVATGTQTPLMLEGGSGAVEIWKDSPATAAASFGMAMPGTATTSDFVFGRYVSGVGGWSESMRIQGTTGRIGVGTSSPLSGLHVHSPTWTQSVRVSGSGGSYLNLVDTSAAANQKFYQWRSEGGLFRLALVNDSEQSFAQQNILVANSSGGVGVGTASPAYRLDVQGGQVNASGGLCMAGDCRTAWSQVGQSQWATGGSGISYSSGNVGVGTSSPQKALDVVGDGHFSHDLTVDGNINAKFQDVAEWVPSSKLLAAGTVVVLDASHNNQVTSSSKAYDTRVAGVVSPQPGITLGERGEGKALVATTGRVRVKVDATKAPIAVGDLLVTSDVEGVAMKSVPVDLGGVQIHRPGTILGKALEPMEKGVGEILVLLTLQ